MARISFACIMTLLAGIFCAETTLASGFTNNSVGSKGILMGSAFTGIADDASAVHYNAAGPAFPAKAGGTRTPSGSTASRSSSTNGTA